MSGSDNDNLNSDTPIVAVEFSADVEEAAHNAGPGINRVAVIGSAVVLFFAALFVIFGLPRFIDDPNKSSQGADAKTQTEEKATDVASTAPAAPLDAEAAAELRRENQTQLESLLNLVNALEAQNVNAWAKAEMAAARSQIDSGEKAYREQRYSDAQAEYNAASNALNAIGERADKVISGAIENGFSAIDAENSAAAKKAFEFALSVDAENARAKLGLARAMTLDQVLALVNEADGYEQLGDTDSALKRYREALALDAQAPKAAPAIARLQQAQLDAKFREAMSTGLAAFDAKQDAKARTAFEQAAKLKPSSAEAQGALSQVNNRILANAIARHLSAANSFEQGEQWSKAAASFRKAIKLDRELNGASASAAHADRRAKLDTNLATTLANPHRLSDDGVHRQALALLSKARAQNVRGPRLSNQIAELDRAITNARTPIPVTLVSDSATDVTLYKVGKLGRFASHAVSVLPGKYVVVGKRDGFRDVRVEFEVSPNNSGSRITVQCKQELAFGS